MPNKLFNININNNFGVALRGILSEAKFVEDNVDII